MFEEFDAIFGRGDNEVTKTSTSNSTQEFLRHFVAKTAKWFVNQNQLNKTGNEINLVELPDM